MAYAINSGKLQHQEQLQTIEGDMDSRFVRYLLYLVRFSNAGKYGHLQIHSLV